MGFKQKSLKAHIRRLSLESSQLKEYIWNICELIHTQAPLEAQDDFMRLMDSEGLYDIKKVEENVLEEE
jgi:hypothetical protein